MEEKPDNDPAVVNENLREFLEKQTRLLDFAISCLREKRNAGEENDSDEDVATTIILMILGMGISCHSILKLTTEIGMQIRDCYGIARSVCEIGINISYIVAVGAEAAALANRHAKQKTYRDLKRGGQIGGVGFSLETSSDIPEPDDIPGMKQALDEFTNKRGKEKTSWTSVSLDDRIKVVDERFPTTSINFGGSMMSIYRHASEILHGTYFSMLHFWGGNRGRITNRAEAEHFFVFHHFISVFSSVFFSCQGVVKVVAEEFDIEELGKANHELFLEFSKYALETFDDGG